MLDALLPTRCAAWDLPAAPGDSFCDAAADTLLAAPADSDGLYATFAFGGALRDALVRAKYDPDEGRARALARLWARALAEGGAPWPELDPAPLCVTFVPAHWRRRLRRGFDLTPLLAASLAGHLGLPVRDLLVCTRHEAPLSAATSTEERTRRAGDRYALRFPEEARALAGSGPVIVVDDVITTGATIRAAMVPLEEAGVEVMGMALARTPLDML